MTLRELKLASYLEACDGEVARRLQSQLERIGGMAPFLAIQEALRHHETLTTGSETAYRVLPPTVVDVKSLTPENLGSTLKSQEATVVLVRQAEMSETTRDFAASHGKSLVRDGKVACVLLAGGQGSRLGFDGPKGSFRPGFPKSNSSIFELLVRRVAKVRELSGAKSLPIFIMTSKQNHAATVTFFKDNHNFLVPETDLFFFEQSVMPSFDMQGQVLLADEDALTENPNGNGGVFVSLKDTKMLEAMKQRGIQMVHIFGVDNVLAKVADPLFIGLCDLAGVSVGNKCCRKDHPEEKVGVQAVQVSDSGSFPVVVEYTEISQNQAEMRVTPGDMSSPLCFSAGNICNHYFRLDFIERIIDNSEYHVAKKKITHWDPRTRAMSVPNEINGIKLEYFIFDAFRFAEKLLAVEGQRESEFSPVKNHDGPDSPATAVRDLMNLHRAWLLAAGVDIGTDKTVYYEIPPSDSYAGEGLESADANRYAA